MFKEGDMIIYGNQGVCTVEAVGKIKMAGIKKGAQYYTLHPYYVKDSTIYSPVDNQKVIMRPVLSREDVLTIVEEIKDIEELWIDDEKKREESYKDAIKSCDCRELVKIIKTIYRRKQKRLAAGKKVTAIDEKYFHLAEESLYGEFGIALGKTKEETKDFLIESLKDKNVNIKE